MQCHSRNHVRTVILIELPSNFFVSESLELPRVAVPGIMKAINFSCFSDYHVDFS